MTSPAVSLYKYTPGARGNCATFSRRSTAASYFIVARYTRIMRRFAYLIAVSAALAVALFAQEPKQQEPPEEDESLVEKEYSFNPLQAAKEMKIGDYYAKKGNHRAAAGRYQEATRWEP